MPDGWTVQIPSEDKQTASLPWTPVTLCDESGAAAGSVGFGIYTHMPDVPNDQYYQLVFSELRLGSLFSWGHAYTPIVTTDTMESATAFLLINQMMQNPNAQNSAALAETTEYPVIMAYDRERLVYIGIQFLPDCITNEELRQIAQSISFED